jgi:hypothetical protein
MNKSDENSLAIWEMKIPRKIFGPIKENGVWKIRGNQESMELHRETDIISGIRI